MNIQKQKQKQKQKQSSLTAFLAALEQVYPIIFSLTGFISALFLSWCFFNGDGGIRDNYFQLWGGLLLIQIGLHSLLCTKHWGERIKGILCIVFSIILLIPTVEDIINEYKIRQEQQLMQDQQLQPQDVQSLK